MPYIKQICGMNDVEHVIVVSPIDDLEERKKMGWGVDTKKLENNNGVDIIISPSDKEVDNLLQKYDRRDTWCMFSGINAFPEVSAWFRLSIGYNVKRGVITEPPYIYDHPLWLHAIRFALKDWKYTKFIDKFFVMGDDFLWYYRLWNKNWKVIPFLYCTEWRERTLPSPKSNKLKILYVGALSHRKNVKELLIAIKGLGKKQANVELGIVGDGKELSNLKKIVDSKLYLTETVFYGSQNMDVIPEIMQQYDILVLPSLHDGWGAVVNEALTLGLFVICSDKCGAKYLLKNDSNGMVYSSGRDEELTSCIAYCQENLINIRKSMVKRILWAKKHISGYIVAEYFCNCLRKQ